MKNSLSSQNIAEVQISYSSKVPASEREQVKCSIDSAKAFRKIFNNIEHHESFYIMLLNRANKVLGYYLVSIGGLTGTVVDQRIIFQVALKANACSIILAHNHPSGQLTPSQADIDLTKKIVSAGQFLDITVLDHIILTAENSYSFADEGLM